MASAPPTRGPTEELDAFGADPELPDVTVPDPPRAEPKLPPRWLVAVAGAIQAGGRRAEATADHAYEHTHGALAVSLEHPRARPLLAIGAWAGFQVGLGIALAAILVGGLLGG